MMRWIKDPFPGALNLKSLKVLICVIYAYIIINLDFLSPPSI